MRTRLGGLAIIENGVPIDILFVMPGTLRSPELARKARERLPNLAVLFTSGYTDNAIVHGGRLDDGVDLLSNPIAVRRLRGSYVTCCTISSTQSWAEFAIAIRR
jgi:hypothetical protein